MKSKANLVLFICLLVKASWVSAEEYHNADLPSLLTKNDGTVVTTPAEWDSRRAELLDLMCDTFTGSFPTQIPAIIGTQVLSETHPADGSTRRNVRLTFDTPNHASFDMWVWSPAGDEPSPLLLTAPRFYQIGWAETALSRGYTVCLYPGVDSNHTEAAYPGYESKWQTFRNEYPGATWTEIATKAWIAGRAIDYLLDPQYGYEIAEDQVGIIGFSRYGKQSMIAGAIDERITSVVARSPGTPGSTPYRFASRTGFNEAPSDWPGEWFLQSLRSYTGREDELPMDAHAWAALIAPRNLLIHTAYNDDSEPTFGVERAYVEGSKVYNLLGVEDHYRVDYRTGGHESGPYPNYITQAQQDRNIDWLDACFGRGTATRSNFPQNYIHQFDWNAWQSNLTAQEKQNPFAGTTPANNADRAARINWAMGQAPAKTPYAGQYTFLTAEESSTMGHDRWAASGTSRMPVSFGDNVRGNLYYKTGQTGPSPVVIWLHPYSYPTGYNEGYGVEDTTVYHRLAAAGYTVLAFDQVGFGLRLLEGRDFYDNDPKWSRLGRMIEDVKAGVDFLVDGTGAAQGTMPAIDTEQIHVLGYSLGGMVGLYSAALDDRIKSVASFSGFTPMRTDTSDKSTGGIERLWDWHALQPMLGLFDGQEGQIPYDYEDVLALVAPRPTLIYSPLNDRDADYDEVTACVNTARTFWQQAGAGDLLTQMSPNDINRFQSAQQQAYINWLSGIVELRTETTWLEGVTPWRGALPDGSNANLRMWLKADAGLLNATGSPVVSGGIVQKWSDQSAADNDLTKHAGYPRMRIITRDGRQIPVVHFDGAAGFQGSLGEFGQAAGSIVFVADQQQGGNQKWLAFRETAGETQNSWIGTGNTGSGDMMDFGIGYTTSEADRFDENAIASSGGLHIYTLTWGEESGQIKARFFVDGRLKHEVGKGLNLSDCLTFDDMLFRLGQRAWDESGFFIGDVGEAFFYNDMLSYQEINDVGAYLAEKYAIDSAFSSADPFPGDANKDGKVDSTDAALMAANWLNSDATWGMGDFNDDGVVNDLDAAILAANWYMGVSRSGSAGDASVPEPGVFVLMLMGTYLLILLR